MSFSNQTEHYGLPLPTGSDKSSWLDTNEAFRNIDSALYRAEQSSGGSTEAIEELQQGQATLTERVTQTNTNLTQEIADRSAGDATLTSRIASAEANINSNHSDIQAALTEIHSIVATLNSELDHIRWQNIPATLHSNMSKAGIVHNVSENTFGLTICSIGSCTPNFMVRNNTDAAISLTSGIALADGKYLIPLFSIPASTINSLDVNPFHLMDRGYAYTISRGQRHKYPASGTDRTFVGNQSLRAVWHTNGIVYIGFSEDTATFSFPARTAYYFEHHVYAHSFGELPSDVEE